MDLTNQSVVKVAGNGNGASHANVLPDPPSPDPPSVRIRRAADEIRLVLHLHENGADDFHLIGRVTEALDRIQAELYEASGNQEIFEIWSA